VLWLGVELPAPVLALQAACEAAAVAEGFEPETRPFRSHLTLGRWRERAPRPALPDVDLGTLALRELVLFRSQLRPSGAVYTGIARFPLQGDEERAKR
jgi:2'-5' RNA ligase